MVVTLEVGINHHFPERNGPNVIMKSMGFGGQTAGVGIPANELISVYFIFLINKMERATVITTLIMPLTLWYDNENQLS